MPGIEFYQTQMGHKFYEGTMPSIARSLEKIAESLEKMANPLFGVNTDDDVDASTINRDAKEVVRHILESIRTGRWSSTEPNPSNVSKPDLNEEMKKQTMINALVAAARDILDGRSKVKAEMLVENLDNVVHELFAEDAAGINNGGALAQIDFIIGNLGLDKGAEIVRGLIKDAREA